MGSNRRKFKKLWLKVPIIIIILLVLSVGIYAFTVYNNAKKTVNDKMHDPVESIDLDLTKKKLKGTKPLNILLMGIDMEESDKGRADALMVLYSDPKQDAMQLVSIPTRTAITGKGTEDKINIPMHSAGPI